MGKKYEKLELAAYVRGMRVDVLEKQMVDCTEGLEMLLDYFNLEVKHIKATSLLKKKKQ